MGFVVSRPWPSQPIQAVERASQEAKRYLGGAESPWKVPRESKARLKPTLQCSSFMLLKKRMWFNVTPLVVFKGERIVIQSIISWDIVSLAQYIQATWVSRAVYGGLRKLSTDQECTSRFQRSSQVTNQDSTKKPLMCHEIPTRSCQSISANLFELNGTDYLVTTDRYSNLF